MPMKTHAVYICSVYLHKVSVRAWFMFFRLHPSIHPSIILYLISTVCLYWLDVSIHVFASFSELHSDIQRSTDVCAAAKFHSNLHQLMACITILFTFFKKKRYNLDQVCISYTHIYTRVSQWKGIESYSHKRNRIVTYRTVCKAISSVWH